MEEIPTICPNKNCNAPWDQEEIEAYSCKSCFWPDHAETIDRPHWNGDITDPEYPDGELSYNDIFPDIVEGC